jgi:hypothetical protein
MASGRAERLASRLRVTGLSRDLLYDQMWTGELAYLKAGRRPGGRGLRAGHRQGNLATRSDLRRLECETRYIAHPPLNGSRSCRFGAAVSADCQAGIKTPYCLFGVALAAERPRRFDAGLLAG